MSEGLFPSLQHVHSDNLRRLTFLRDIMTTFVETPMGDWSTVSKTERDGGSDRLVVSFVIRATENNDCTEWGRPIEIDAKAVYRGLRRAILGPTNLHSSNRAKVYAAWLSLDGGEVDAEMADWIIQAAIFDGELVFG